MWKSNDLQSALITSLHKCIWVVPCLNNPEVDKVLLMREKRFTPFFGWLGSAEIAIYKGIRHLFLSFRVLLNIVQGGIKV